MTGQYQGLVQSVCLDQLVLVSDPAAMFPTQWTQRPSGERLGNPADPVQPGETAAASGSGPLPLHLEERRGDGPDLRPARHPDPAGPPLPGRETPHPGGEDPCEPLLHVHVEPTRPLTSSPVTPPGHLQVPEPAAAGLLCGSPRGPGQDPSGESPLGSLRRMSEVRVPDPRVSSRSL